MNSPQLKKCPSSSSPHSKQSLAIVGDLDERVKCGIMNLIASDACARTLHLSNDYYDAEVEIQVFYDIKDVSEAVQKGKVIPALIIRFTSMEVLEESVQHLALINADCQILVRDRLSGDLTDVLVEKWVRQNKFEEVYLQLTTEQLEEYTEANETYGMQRVCDALNVCLWPVRNEKVKKVVGNIEVDRILKNIYALPDANENDDDLMPDSAALEEIFKTMVLPSRSTTIPEPKQAELVHLPSISPTECEAHFSEVGDDHTSSVSVEVEISLEKPEPNNSIYAESTIDEKNKKNRKKRKGKSDKANSEPNSPELDG